MGKKIAFTPMKLEFTSDWDKLNRKLTGLVPHARIKGKRIVAEAARRMDRTVREHLEGQGRGGYPPPLSEMTRHIYQVDGEPDGSEIRNHLVLEIDEYPDRTVAILGIPQGKPTVVAKVQDQGATIPVTEKMRGFLAANYGIFLSAKTTHITVPGRKFWEESLRKTRSHTLKEFSRFFTGF